MDFKHLLIPAGNYMFEVNNCQNFTPCSNVSIANFEQINTDWDVCIFCKKSRSIYTLTGDGSFASLSTFQFCIPYWLYSEDTTSWREKSYKKFLQFFFVRFMKSFLHSFKDLSIRDFGHPPRKWSKVGSGFLHLLEAVFVSSFIFIASMEVKMSDLGFYLLVRKITQ